MQKSKSNRKLVETGIWLVGLIAVAVADPWAPSLINACLFEAAGLSFCPGHGLGHAVGFMARGEFLLSFQSHPFAIPVVGVLLSHIYSLIHSASALLQTPTTDVQNNQIPTRA
ncbi:MAG: DUF2752 domain-containing protein [Bacteroidetes bacterium]|nr:MAG: DUF2752 domain-containing protein [Bacteroidota bacterium]